MRRLAILLLVLALPQAALAHKLRVFAAVEDGAVTGYAFFVGGGRPQDVPWQITDATGAVLAEGRTDDAGVYRWTPPAPQDLTVTVNAEDGHFASATVTAARFGGQEAPPVAQPETPAVTAPAPDDEAVAAAVRREMLPLLERIEEMDNRLRFTDVISGVFLIQGAAGGILWLRGRKGGA